MNHKHIPADLRERSQWVCWQRELSPDGKPTKVPYCAADPGRRASSTDPSSWSTYEQALAVVEQERADGVGFVFTADDPFVGIDLDHCRNAESGVILPAAQVIVDDFHTYTEVSQSSTGVHLILRGQMPAGAKHKKRLGGFEVEIYESGRYFCVTGEQLGTVTEVNDCQAALEALCAQLWPPQAAADQLRTRANTPKHLGDSEVLERMFAASNGAAIEALYHGSVSDHDNDDSRADAALLTHLAWWTNNDAEQMERLFRSSGLYREKWERADYREASIAFAIEANGSAGYSSLSSPSASGAAITSTERASSSSASTQRSVPVRSEENTQRRDYHCSDSGNAERLIACCGERVRYCARLKLWFIYDGTRWAPDDTLQIEDFAGEALRGIYDEAHAASDPDRRAKLGRWAAASEALMKRRACVNIARSDRRLVVRVSDFDRNPADLNCLSGTIDLRSGLCRKHDAADMITMLAPVSYEPDARSELWQQTLLDVCGGDEEYVAYLQRFYGYAASAEVKEEIFAVQIGPTQTGKNTINEAIKATLGDYAATVDPSTLLLAKYASATRDDLLQLDNKRLAVSAEAPREAHFDESLLKMFTGEHALKKRGVYHADREFRPTAKLLLHTNFMPEFSDDDEAFCRRFHVQPFAHHPAQIDATIKPTLSDVSISGPAILAWLVKGHLSWRECGLDPPQVVRKATAAQRLEMNPLLDFFADCCIFAANQWCSRADLLDVYTGWCQVNHVRHPLSARAFAERVRKAGGSDKDKRVRGWSGVGLK